jgi:hypothetical protein
VSGAIVCGEVAGVVFGGAGAWWKLGAEAVRGVSCQSGQLGVEVGGGSVVSEARLSGLYSGVAVGVCGIWLWMVW